MHILFDVKTKNNKIVKKSNDQNMTRTYIIIRTESCMRQRNLFYIFITHIPSSYILRFICVDIIILIRGANKLILTA